ncbi:MAG TPA: cyclic nucleotide-binding domain-containing protein, partial [Nitriliruptoraceae bacterium]|nr:cyclic nucleotide-binding domain-containing protein [Nitriliruptoraceae bacterium]
MTTQSSPAGVGAELFARLGSDDVEIVEVAEGEVVIRHGRPVDGLSHVITGRLEATVHSHGVRLLLGEIEPGDVIGEISLLAGGMATATVTATAPTRLAFLPAAQARAALAEQPDVAASLAAGAAERVDRNALVSVLAEVTEDTDVDRLAAAAGAMDLARLRAGHVLLTQGDEAESAYLVVSGQLVARVVDPDGGEREVGRLGRGQLVGEAALFERSTRSATVVAVRDTVVAELRMEVFHAMLAADPAAMARVTRQLVERMGRTPLRSRSAVSTIAVVTADPTSSARVVTTQIVDVLGAFGTVAHVTAARVDADLETAGIAHATRDDPAIHRLAGHLHEVEVANDVTVLEVGRDSGEWGLMALATADRVLVVLRAQPNDEERRAVIDAVARAGAATPVNAVLIHPDDTDQPRGSAELRTSLGVDRVLHARRGRRADLARAARITAGRAVGLALGGGGARGFAHVGVQRVLRERGVPIDVLAGASIGAPIAGGMACDVSPADM